MRLLITFLCLTAFPVIHAQKWGHNTTSKFTNEALDIETDSSGNSYITGYITGETAFDPTVTQPTAPGNGDIYLAKYNPKGKLLWIKQFGGSFSDRAYDLAIGPDQQPVFTGQFFGAVDFGTVHLQSAANSKDIFLAKADASGNILWARKEGGDLAENAYGVTVDKNNNVALTGQFQGVASVGNQNFTSKIDPTSGEYSYDLFVSRYTSSGIPMWVKTGATSYEDRGLAVSTDTENNVYMTGQFSDTLVFAGQTFNNNAYNAGFVAKLSPTGQLLWLHTIRGGYVAAYDLELNADKEVIVTGDFLGNMVFTDEAGNHTMTNPYDRKIFILKINSNGNLVWNTAFGSDNEVSSRSVSIDADKNIFITGYFKCSFSQFHQPKSLFNSVGFKDPYVLEADNQGKLVFIKQLGGKMDDEGQGIAVNATGNPVLCGSYTKDLMIKADPAETYSQDQFELHTGNSGDHFMFMDGDSTRNSFLTNIITKNTPDYNYFGPGITDSLYGGIYPGGDTLHSCKVAELYYDVKTESNQGPDYTYAWSNGSTEDNSYPNVTGLNTVLVQRQDHCASFTDSIFVVIHTPPSFPLMTDNLGIATDRPGENYGSYTLCAGDSLQVWFSHMDTDATFKMTGPAYSSTNIAPQLLTKEGGYHVSITNAYCNSLGYLNLTLDHTDHDTMNPYLKLKDLKAHHDSIRICTSDQVNIIVLDSITNPTGHLTYPTQIGIAGEKWTVTPSCDWSPTKFGIQLNPLTSGWYTLDYKVLVGYNNACGVDTTAYYARDSFYVEVIQAPSFSATIGGNNLLCPKGSLYLSVSGTNHGLDWYGPQITWESADKDSIQITSAGTYYYGGYVTDPVTGCTTPFDTELDVFEKYAPPINSDPADGIICPHDSILLQAPSGFNAYKWIGPAGDQLSSVNTLEAHEIGFYYCEITDPDGCVLTTPPFELKEFTTPYLSVEPSTAICDGQPITFTVVYFGDATFQWQAPLSGNSPTMTVSQPGVYQCQIQQCGVTLSESIEIIDGSFDVAISAADSVLCFGEVIEIDATSGLGSYNWSNGVLDGSELSVSEAGSYSVTVTNSYGCHATSNTINVTRVPGSFPPSVPGVTICPGASVTLTDTSSFITQWYSTDTTLLTTAQQFNLTNVQKDTIILAAYKNDYCSPAFAIVHINVAKSPAGSQILGDSLLCPGETTSFTFASTTETIDWYIGTTAIGSGQSITVNQQDFAGMTNPSITAVLSNMCFSNISITEPVYFAVPDTISINQDSLTVCLSDAPVFSVSEQVTSTTWTSNLGSVTTDNFQFSPGILTGYMYAQSVDLNGCTTNRDSVFLTVSTFDYTLHSNFGNACPGEAVSLGVTANPNPVTFYWETPGGQNSNTDISFSLTTATDGMYIIHMTDALGCNYTDSIDAHLNQGPLFELKTDSLMCLQELFTYNLPLGDYDFYWKDFGGIENVTVTGKEWLILIATSPQGCVYTDTIYVDGVSCDNELPNVFTPNGDGINDIFLIDEAPIYPNNNLFILNRWGDVVFSAHPYKNDFTGTGLTDGVYFYTFQRDPVNEPDRIVRGFVEIFH